MSVYTGLNCLMGQFGSIMQHLTVKENKFMFNRNSLDNGLFIKYFCY